MATLKHLENELRTDTLKSTGHALAGACAGACALTLLFPLDTVKTRSTTRSGKIYTYQGMMGDLLRFRNISDLFRGYKMGLLEVILFQGVHFFFYNLLKNDWIKKNVANYKELEHIPPIPPLQSVMRGCFAGLLTQLLTTPFGVIKARLQTSNTNETVLDVVKSIYEDDGITGFWRGMKTSVFLIINPVIVFFVFERLQEFLQTKFGKSFWVDFATGGISKSVAAIITQPLTFIKTNLQVAQKNKSFESKTTLVALKQPHNFGNNNNDNNSNNNITNNGNGVSILNNVDEEEVMQSEKQENNNINLFSPMSDESNNNNNNITKNRVRFEENTYTKEIDLNDSFERTASMSSLLKYTIKNEGFGGLYQGLGPKLLHAALMYAFIFSCKEKFTYYTFFALVLLTTKKNPNKTVAIVAK